MSVRIAINGFGRIGRLVTRIASLKKDIEIVAINDLADIKSSAHLFKYDSLYGTYAHNFSVKGDDFIINGKKAKYLSEREPSCLPWQDLGVQIVVEGTGVFRKRKDAEAHLAAGADKVVITAPAKDVEQTIVMGVNHHDYRPEYKIVSNASCTTNCLAPVAKVVLDNFGIEHGVMNTVHSYTNDQRVLDLEHEDLRRSRAAGLSLIPTTTGAATAVELVMPVLKGKLDGISIRVPTPVVSLVDLTVELTKPATAKDLNEKFQQAAEGELKGILKYTEEPLVSSDYKGEESSAVVDGLLTMAVENKIAKIVAWYDNEWGYSSRVVDVVSYIADKSYGNF
ncbi:MAG: type I glyceraldehyde-3-phosphate dehydrogenase [Syntrophomonadaceae bacterium]|nr:type I glyceraldehyde-3-phosphate dehydrogenase [Syntrophomonadaceae bacterium]